MPLVSKRGTVSTKLIAQVTCDVCGAFYESEGMNASLNLETGQYEGLFSSDVDFCDTCDENIAQDALKFITRSS